MHLVSCINTHHDVTDLANYGIVKNTKTWLSWEGNILFLRNKKILNLCFRWHILRSYRFVAEVTFRLYPIHLWSEFSLHNNMFCLFLPFNLEKRILELKYSVKNTCTPLHVYFKTDLQLSASQFLHGQSWSEFKSYPLATIMDEASIIKNMCGYHHRLESSWILL